MMPELAPRFRAGAAFLAVSEEAFPLVSGTDRVAFDSSLTFADAGACADFENADLA
jgi:hypothetical protein